MISTRLRLVHRGLTPTAHSHTPHPPGLGLGGGRFRNLPVGAQANWRRQLPSPPGNALAHLHAACHLFGAIALAEVCLYR